MIYIIGNIVYLLMKYFIIVIYNKQSTKWINNN